MKFYRENINPVNYWHKIKTNKLNAIYYHFYSLNLYRIESYKNGIYHNTKNAAYIDHLGYKEFYLNNQCYGNQYVFTKKSWRRFVKIQVFL